MNSRAGEQGSILPLIFGFFALGLALVLVATAATSLYLGRSRLYTLADGAALAAANSLALRVAAADAGVATADGAGGAAGFDDRVLRAAASDYLAAAAASRRTPVTLVAAATPDGRTARVRLSETWRPPVVSAFLPHGVVIEVEGSARPVFW